MRNTTCHRLLQHFIFDFHENYCEAIDKAVVQVSRIFFQGKLRRLIINGTGVGKRGDKNEEIGWQYCGNIGRTITHKIANVVCCAMEIR